VLRDGLVLPWLREWRQRPQRPRLLLAMALPLQPSLVSTAWRAGVDALLCRDDYGRGELVRALEVVTKGGRYRGPAFDSLLQRQPAADALTRRELEVLPLLVEGFTNRQIAERLQIAEVTARDHVQRILQKLQVSDRTAAAALAVRLGLAV
jgi:DNA-binding NarL/FixJ family response regulator